MSNHLSITGNITSDPELQFGQSGVARCTFTIADTERVFDRNTNEWKDGHTNFVRVVLWRQDAENAAESLTKGTRVTATGKLVVRTYDRTDGNGKGTSVEIHDAELAVSLRHATAKVTRNQRNGQGAPAPQPASAGTAPAPAPAPAPAGPQAGAGAGALDPSYF